MINVRSRHSSVWINAFLNVYFIVKIDIPGMEGGGDRQTETVRQTDKQTDRQTCNTYHRRCTWGGRQRRRSQTKNTFLSKCQRNNERLIKVHLCDIIERNTNSIVGFKYSRGQKYKMYAPEKRNLFFISKKIKNKRQASKHAKTTTITTSN